MNTGSPQGADPVELSGFTARDVEAQFPRHFSPENLTVVLVGSFDPARPVLAKQYFGRLEPGPEPGRRRGAETWKRQYPGAGGFWSESATVRHRYECSTGPSPSPIRCRGLDAVAGLLNGPTGRLTRSLVLEAAWRPRLGRSTGSSRGRKADLCRYALEGWSLQCLEGHGWTRYAAPERKVGGAELRKLKNQVMAEGYRRMDKPSSLMMRLLIYDSLGDWRYLTTWARQVEKLTAEAIQAGAKRYLTPEASATGHARREPIAVSGGG